MLSSISSFLPSALQIGNDKSPPSPTEQQRQLTASPTKDPDMTGDGSNVKKKKERTNEVRFPISFPLDSGTWQGLAKLSGCLRCLHRDVWQVCALGYMGAVLSPCPSAGSAFLSRISRYWVVKCMGILHTLRRLHGLSGAHA